MSAKFAGGNVLNANKLVSPTFENKGRAEMIRDRLDKVEWFLFDTFRARAGVTIPGSNWGEWGGAGKLFNGIRCSEDLDYTNCAVDSEKGGLNPPAEMHIRETRIIGDPNLDVLGELTRFMFGRRLNVEIGQKRYEEIPLALLDRPTHVIKHACEPLWLLERQSWYVTFAGPAFTPERDFNIVVGFFGTLYRGVC